MKRRVAVFQHVAFEDLGSFEQVLHDRGFEIDVFQLGADDLACAYSRDPELLLVTGGPTSVIPTLRSEGQRHAEVLRARAQAFLHDWLSRRGL